MNAKTEPVLTYLQQRKQLDFSGYRSSMVKRRIRSRIVKSGHCSYETYFRYLKAHDEELEQLVDALTINVSGFFRNPLAFEYIAEKILPDLVQKKAATADPVLRIWSAGCSTGEEPYSLAMLINEVVEKENQSIDSFIFASDIDEGALERAKNGIFHDTRMKEVKYGLLNKYFTRNGTWFKLAPEITRMVRFSNFNLLDNHRYAPPDCVFGGFDMVLCRNVLIYFRAACQDLIFDKLHRSLEKDGFLVLGEAERPLNRFRPLFRRKTETFFIYQKI